MSTWRLRRTGVDLSWRARATTCSLAKAYGCGSSAGSGVPAVESIVPGTRFGAPRLVTPRLGQGSFRLAVYDAYDRACAVTGEHSLPALEASHIKPYAIGGAHDVSNGLPLRRDLHRLFDLGYVSFDVDLTFMVSDRLRLEYDNGRAYYEMSGRQLRVPSRVADRPDPEHLAWHRESVYRAG